MTNRALRLLCSICFATTTLAGCYVEEGPRHPREPREEVPAAQPQSQAVYTPPPAPPANPPPDAPAPAPAPGQYWVAGYYRWNGSSYDWVPGHFEHQPHAGAQWIGGHWERRGNGNGWVDAHWQ